MLVKRSDLIDVALAIAVTASLVTERAFTAASSDVPLAVSIALALVIGGSLSGCRRWPFAAYAIGSAAMIAESVWGVPSTLSPYANLIGLFSLGLYGSRNRAWWGLLIFLPGVFAYFASSGEPLGEVTASVIFVWGAAWALGYQSARGREQQDAARAAHRREVIADERLRIARDLHDVVGHTVNLMLVQAGATRVVMDRDPAKARQLLGQVEQAGREALDELDEMLGLLRDDAAQPGIAQLPALAARLASAGLQVSLDIDANDVPPERDVAVYRITQEALTNSVRHGGATEATVRVRAQPLIVEVHDNGRGASVYTPGRGLRGMAERAALLGGSVEHHSDDEGFHLRAQL